MSEINFFNEEVNVENKKVILRLDLNVPISEGTIQDFTRIDVSLPFIKNLREKKAKIILVSHLGRPKGKFDESLSLKPIFEYLKKKLTEDIYFYSDLFSNDLKNKIAKLKAGEIILLENIRFFQEEVDDDDNFAKKLSSLGEIYINDAFSCSHRKQASVHKITKFIDTSYAGPILKKEILALNLITQQRKEPVTCIIGGSKISTKIDLISSLMLKVNNIIVVGAMANNFLKFKGLEIGKSLFEKNSSQIVERIYLDAKKYNCKIIIPSDCMISKNMGGVGTVKNNDEVKNNEIILDIGPKTIEKIKTYIDDSKTIFWNGPAGYFENDNFLNGTETIAVKISINTKNSNLISIVGGGDTISAINKIKQKLLFTHLSTAGGAFLEYLKGKDLPAISVLK